MCILYLYIDNNASNQSYNLILANNRDEAYSRPTKPAHFWSENCISGVDMQPNREGGTWLGVSKDNKIASLLNILQPKVDLDKKGRGNLVVDYLVGSQSACCYLGDVAKQGPLYNGFHLLCLERKQSSWHGHLYSNKDQNGSCIIPQGISILCNSLPKTPWQKAVCTEPVFSDIVSKYNHVEREDDLCSQLITMLNDKTPYLPDAVLSEQGSHLNDTLLRERSAVCVHSPSVHFGSRTNTIILVDSQGHCTYVERTMREPINCLSPVWDTTQHHFTLNESLQHNL